MDTLSLRVLGTPQTQLGDAPVTGFISRKSQALLFYLAVTDQPSTRAFLAGLLWGDMPEPTARRNLSKALSNLRHLVGDYLHIERQVIRLATDSNTWVDVREFERVMEHPAAQPTQQDDAAALYRGDFLEGFYVRNAPDFEAWARGERERLRQSMLDLLLRLADHHGQGDDWAAAIAHLRRLLHMDPAHEDAHRRLMHALVHNGQRSAALAQFERCRQALAEELDVDPAPDTVALYERIRSHAAQPAPRTTTPPPQATRIAPEDATRLVGRAREWQMLQTAWQRAHAGAAHFCLIRGEAGIGKTRLADELLRWTIPHDVAAARTRAYAAAGTLVYTPLIEWLRSDAIRPTLAQLDPVWLTEVARLLPELHTAHPDLPRPEPWATGAPGQWQRQRLFEALAHAVLVESRPKLLLLDDLQWCDAETLAWLHYLLRFAQAGHTAPPQLLIVGTLRPEEVDHDHPLTSMLLEWQRARVVTEIELTPLSEAYTVALAQQTAADELGADAARALYQYTEGNPLFVIETLRSADWKAKIGTGVAKPPGPIPVADDHSLPPRVYAVIQSRLAQLSPTARNLVQLAAVVGRAFTFDLLHRSGDWDEPEVADGLDELWQRGIIRARDAVTYDFSHDRIREAAQLNVSPVARPRLHRRIAAALEQIYADDLDAISAQLAVHHAGAGEVGLAVEYYRRAAMVAQSRLAYADAVDWLYRARELLGRLSASRKNQVQELAILLELRTALSVAQGLASAQIGEVCMRAITLCQELDDQKQLFHALSGMRSFHQMRGRNQEAKVLAKQMLTVAEDMRDAADVSAAEQARFLILAHHGLGNILFFTGESIAAQAHYNEAISLQQPIQGVLILAALNLWLLGYPDQARCHMYQALVLARARGHPTELGFAMTNLARINYFLRRGRLVKLWAQKTIALCAPHDIPFWTNLCTLFLGYALAEDGEKERGFSLLRTALAHLDENGQQAFCSHLWSLPAEAYAHAGRWSDAVNALDRAMIFVEQNGERFWHAELLRLRGELLAAQGAPATEVEAAYQRAIAAAQQQSAKSLELRASVSLARLWQQQGKRSEAHTMLSEIYGWFTEGFETADLREARALLTELAG